VRPPIPNLTPAEFWEAVTPEPNTGCWILPFGRDNDYSQARVNGVLKGAHRHALELARGIPLGDLQANHHCDFKPCCNPDHLYAGTQSQNVLDMFRRSNAAEKISATITARWADPEWVRQNMKWLRRLAKARGTMPPRRRGRRSPGPTPKTRRPGFVPRDPRLSWRRPV
jgi:hypothetical protein